MANAHNDPNAKRLWRCCARDEDLRWLLEGVFDTRALGRMLLLSPHELFGEEQAPAGKRLSVLFRLSGFPYVSHRFQSVFGAVDNASANRDIEGEQLKNAKRSIDDWKSDSGRHALDLLMASAIETVRRNESLRVLATSAEAIKADDLKRSVRDYESLDWTAMESLLSVMEEFLARKPSKKAINRFTLNFTALLKQFQPEIAQEHIVLWSARHFAGLLQRRAVSESVWRGLLFDLIDRELVIPQTCLFLWCLRCPHGGFIASSSLAFGQLPPLCPSCGRNSHAMAAFAPHRYLRETMELKDGLLGAAVGWHLKRGRIPFDHSRHVNGTEFDFIARLRTGSVLIECKMLKVSGSSKQQTRNVRESLTQLKDHAVLLRNAGQSMTEAICVVNLTHAELSALRRSGLTLGTGSEGVISYERFPRWLSSRSR